MMEDTKIALRSQVKSTTTLVLCILSVLLCKWIALIFFVIAYNNYEKAADMITLGNYSAAQENIAEAAKNFHLGIIIAIICIIIEIVISTVVVVGLWCLFVLNA